jgi:hypothetical protein
MDPEVEYREREMELVKEIAGHATPERVSRIANLIGGSPEQARRGLDAAIPAVLAGILGAGGDPGAAQALGNALARSGRLGDLAQGDPGAGAAAGADMVGSVIGGSGIAALSQALARHVGLTPAGGGSLAGTAGALALATLGREATAKGLDTTAVLGLLGEQKAAIAKALPRDLAGDLGGTGLLDGLGNLSHANPVKVISKPLRAVNPVPAVPVGAPATTGWWRWVLFVAVICVAAFVAVVYLVPGAPVEPPATPAAASNPMLVAGTDIGEPIAAALATIKASLDAITDEASADSELPSLMAARDQLDSVEDNVDSLSEAGHAELRQMLAAALPGIEDSANRVLDIDGASAAVKPVVDDILAQLTAFSN